MRSQSPRLSDVQHDGCYGGRREQSPSPLTRQSDSPSGTGDRRAASVGRGARTAPAPQLELLRSSCSTPPEDRVLYADMERLFDVYRRYERRRLRQDANCRSPLLSGADLESRLVAELQRGGVGVQSTESFRKGTKQSRSESRKPATCSDSRTVQECNMKWKLTCSKPSPASLQKAVQMKSAAPLTRQKPRPHRPEAVLAPTATGSSSTVYTNVSDFMPPRRHSGRTFVASKSSGNSRAGTRRPQVWCQSSVRTTEMFQSDSCQPGSVQSRPVTMQPPFSSVTYVHSGKREEVIGDSFVRYDTNTPTIAEIHSRSASADRSPSTQQRSAQSSALTVFNPETPFTNRVVNRPCGDATCQITSAQRLSRPRPRVAATFTNVATTSNTSPSCDGLGRDVRGYYAARHRTTTFPEPHRQTSSDHRPVCAATKQKSKLLVELVATDD